MWRIVLRIVLAVLAAGFVALSVISDLYRLPVLAGLPVWVWYALAGIACTALSLTWIRSKPSTWPGIIKLRLKIAGLKLLLWVINRKAFQYVVLRPILLGFMFWVIWKMFKAPEQIQIPDPKAMEMLAQIKAMLERRTDYPTDEAARERGAALNQTMTWGVAGAALVLLTTVIVATHPLTDKAALIAAACFAYAIPTLVMCGFIQLSYAGAKLSDQGIQPPTLRQVMKVMGRTHMAYFVVCVGMAAMLWSYDWKISGVFVVSLYWAYRLYRRTVTVGTPKQQLTAVSTPEVVNDDKAA